MPRNKLFALWLTALCCLGCAGAPPERILSMVTSVTDVLCRAGYVERLAGTDEYSAFLVPESAELPVLARNAMISPEAVLARRIDLAFVWWYQTAAARQLERLGIPVVLVPPLRTANLEEFFQLVENNTQVELESVLPELPVAVAVGAETIYWELYAPMQTPGRESYPHDLLTLAGWRNAAAEAVGTVLLTREELLTADPEVVLLTEGFTTVEEFIARPGFAALQAVRTKRVYVVSRRWLVAGGALPEAVRMLKSWKENTDAVL